MDIGISLAGDIVIETRDDQVARRMVRDAAGAAAHHDRVQFSAATNSSACATALR